MLTIRMRELARVLMLPVPPGSFQQLASSNQLSDLLLAAGAEHLSRHFREHARTNTKPYCDYAVWWFTRSSPPPFARSDEGWGKENAEARRLWGCDCPPHLLQ